MDPVEPKRASPAFPSNDSAGALFVGRDRELGELRAALTGVFGGRGAIFLVYGEPGVGKTRLADELSKEAEASGVRSLWGTCIEGGGAPAFWPWVQVLRQVAERGVTVPPQRLGRGAEALHALVPELGGDAEEGRRPAEGEEERFLLFDAVTALLREVARSEPLLLVLDDLHAADLPSVVLLDFVAAQLRNASILVIGTYRDLEAERRPEVGRLLANVARRGQGLPLGGLASADVARYVGHVLGARASESLAGRLHDLTGGNPLFVGELVRVLAADGALHDEGRLAPGRVAPAPAIREAIRRRIELLPERTREVLTIAAVIGKEIDAELLGRISGLSRPEVAELLREAVAARVLSPPPMGAVRSAFSHALFREALYDDLTAARRVELHGKVARILVDLHASHLEPHVAEIAHHFCEAAAVDEQVPEARRYSARAGERAMKVLAYEAAAEHFERALAVGGLRAPPDAQERCRLLLFLAEARRGAGDWEGMKQALWPGAELAVECGGRDEVARAATAILLLHDVEIPEEAHAEWLRKALATVGDERSALRARLQAGLAATLVSLPTAEDAQPLASDALALARELGDRETLVHVLVPVAWAKWGPDGHAESLALAEEALRLAEEEGSFHLAAVAHAFRHCLLLEHADRERADLELSTWKRIVEKTRLPALRGVLELSRVCRTLLDGRLAEAEDLVGKLLEISPTPEDTMRDLVPALLVTRREQGRLAEVAGAALALPPRLFELPLWRAVAAWTYAHLGDHERARSSFEQAAAGLEGLRRDSGWLSALSLLSEVTVALRNLERAGALYRLLAPYSRFAGVIPVIGIYLGSVARRLGQLAALRSDSDAAERHFEEALAIEERMRARPWLARAQAEYARFLLGRGVDRERAQTLLGAARSTARELGMKALEEEIDALAVEDSPVAAKASAATAGVFRNDGEYWTIAHRGPPLRLRDSVGLRFIALLLRHPDRDFHALDMILQTRSKPSAESAPTITAAAAAQAGLTIDAGDGGEAGLDAKAKATYQRRLEDLRDELEEATAFNDPGRAEKARGEIERLSHELARSVGLGGRDRRGRTAAERARVSVTKRIHETIGRIGENDAPLARHLSRTITTGTFCRYRPDPDAPVSWQL